MKPGDRVTVTTCLAKHLGSRGQLRTEHGVVVRLNGNTLRVRIGDTERWVQRERCAPMPLGATETALGGDDA